MAQGSGKAKKKSKMGVKNLIDVALEGKDALAGADERVCVRVAVGPSCSRELASALKGLLVAEKPTGIVEVLAAGAAVSDEPCDYVLVLAGGFDARPVVLGYARQGVPVAVLVEGVLDAPALDLPEELIPYVEVVCASTPDVLQKKLASWLSAAGDKSLALAANFPFMRPAVADSLIGSCAVDNAVVGAVSLIPGSDLPIMCTAQAKLALDLAAAYGRELEPIRAAEVAAVVGAGFAWRAVARALADVAPGVQLVIKSAIGFGGTFAAGRLVQFLFDVEDGKVELPSFDLVPPAAEEPLSVSLLAEPESAPAYITY